MSKDNFTSDNHHRSNATRDRQPDYRFDELQNRNADSGYPSVNAAYSAAAAAARQPNQNYNQQQQSQMMTANAANNDEKHLDQLSLGFKIYALINGLFSCFPFIHLFMGIMMVMGKFEDGRNGGPPAAFGWIFIIVASVFILGGWTVSICNFFAGKFLKERRNYMFCFVMSCLNCLFMPIGTILGVFSIIVLQRENVKELFGRGTAGN